MSVSQSSDYVTDNASHAVDGDLRTISHTVCAYNTDIWYKMQFAAVYCFSDVTIIQSHLSVNAYRMEDAKVFIGNFINNFIDNFKCNFIPFLENRYDVDTSKCCTISFT